MPVIIGAVLLSEKSLFQIINIGISNIGDAL